MRDDENAQIHILEMLTLFWLFFMTAAFLITVMYPMKRVFQWMLKCNSLVRMQLI